MRPPGGGPPTQDEGAADDPPGRRAEPPRTPLERVTSGSSDSGLPGPGGAPGERSEAAGEVVEEVPLHPALVPQGEAIEWSALGSLLGGPVVWGGIGALADHVLGTGRIFLVIGLVVGTVTGMWIVYVRFGQDDTGTPRS